MHLIFWESNVSLLSIEGSSSALVRLRCPFPGPTHPSKRQRPSSEFRNQCHVLDVGGVLVKSWFSINSKKSPNTRVGPAALYVLAFGGPWTQRLCRRQAMEHRNTTLAETVQSFHRGRGNAMRQTGSISLALRHLMFINGFWVDC